LYLPEGVDQADVVPESTESFRSISLQHSVNRMLGRMLGHQEQAFAEYQAYEKSLPCALDRISSYSESILSFLDMAKLFARRRENFLQLVEALADSNSLAVRHEPMATPFVYPFLPRQPIPRAEFHKQQIFVPTLWPDVLTRPAVTCQTAVHYTENLIAFPIDHRYGALEMQRIVDVTRALENQT
jgi:hypothetical protein